MRVNLQKVYFGGGAETPQNIESGFFLSRARALLVNTAEFVWQGGGADGTTKATRRRALQE